MEMKPMEMDTQETESEKDDPKYGKYQEWEIEHAADVLKEAEEIKADPEKLKYVKMCMKHEIEESQKALSQISSIDDLKAKIKSKQDQKSVNEPK